MWRSSDVLPQISTSETWLGCEQRVGAAARRIEPNYLSDPDDLRMAIEGLRFARRVMSSPSMKPFLARERMPGPDEVSDTDLASYIREWAKTDYHPVGACKMGTDSLSVVDPELRVRGIEGLRVGGGGELYCVSLQR
jgi:choline dehydrogenase-like flavoprotein